MVNAWRLSLFVTFWVLTDQLLKGLTQFIDFGGEKLELAFMAIATEFNGGLLFTGGPIINLIWIILFFFLSLYCAYQIWTTRRGKNLLKAWANSFMLAATMSYFLDFITQNGITRYIKLGKIYISLADIAFYISCSLFLLILRRKINVTHTSSAP
jgi:hypothetical protein